MPCARLARAACTCAAACSRCAATSRFSSRAMTSPSLTIWPSCTPSHSRRPVPFDETDARRAATTRPVALSTDTEADGYAAATVANSTAAGALRLRPYSAAATTSAMTTVQNHQRFHSGRRRRGTRVALRSIASRSSEALAAGCSAMRDSGGRVERRHAIGTPHAGPCNSRHSNGVSRRGRRRRSRATGLARPGPAGNYLPMQNRLKIAPSRSSAETSPVISPSALPARRSSSA